MCFKTPSNTMLHVFHPQGVQNIVVAMVTGSKQCTFIIILKTVVPTYGESVNILHTNTVNAFTMATVHLTHDISCVAHYNTAVCTYTGWYRVYVPSTDG